MAALASLSVCCSDDENSDVVLDLSKKEVWLCNASGASQRVIVSAPAGWTCTDIPEWCSVAPSSAAGSREIKITCLPNEDKTRKAILRIRCADGQEVEYRIKQSGKYIVNGFPVEWLFTADYYASGKYTSAFVDDNALPAEVGTGYISYTRNPEYPTDGDKFLITIGGTGHPYVRSFMKGDSWTFTVPVTEEAIPEGATMNVKFITRSSAGGPRYMMVEYFEDGEWNAVGELRRATVDGEGEIAYNVDLTSDLTGNKKLGTDNAQVDMDFVLKGGCAVGGEVRVRYRAVSNMGCNGTVMVLNHNQTNRLAGAIGTSPVVSVKDLPDEW